MKKIILIMGGVSFLWLVIFACTATNPSIVSKSADINADFKSIETYNWTQGIDNIPNDRLFIGPNGVFVYNNESGRKMLKDAIEYELDAKGYKRNSTSPDILVSFAVLEQPGTLRTTNGYVTLSSGEKVRTEDNISYTDVKPGTLIINFTDAKNNNQIWQGFASGILQAKQMRDESKVRQAVSRIFAEFQYNNNM